MSNLNPNEIIIRLETPADYPAIATVNITAWQKEGPGTAPLVEQIRTSGDMITSLVAVHDGRIVGHILFSRLLLELENGSTETVASLAPLVVDPACQKKGIGSRLTRRGIEECGRQGYRIMVVLGHPGYYPRFGFSPVLAEQIASPFSGKAAWMAQELEPGALTGVKGKITYPPYFNI